MSLRSKKLTIAYDGTNYCGWQRQPDQPSVQGELERALERIAGKHVSTIASGRTDAGVHALGQVVGIRLETRLDGATLRRALCANLPDDIEVLDVEDAPDSFHPIGDATGKRYRYVIEDGPTTDVFMRRYVWRYVRGRLDAAAMARAAEGLLGRHDFSSFETTGAPRKDSIRTVRDLLVRRTNVVFPDPASPPPEDASADRIIIEVEADGFLYNMVRAIVGTLVEVGRRAEDESWPGRVLAATDRSAAGPTAPATGLFLVRVDYPF